MLAHKLLLDAESYSGTYPGKESQEMSEQEPFAPDSERPPSEQGADHNAPVMAAWKTAVQAARRRVDGCKARLARLLGSAGILASRSGESAEGHSARWQDRLGQPMRRVPTRWRIWLVALASVLILSLCVLFFERKPAVAPPAPRQTAPGVWRFAVGSRPTLVFRHSIGNVHIVSGAAGQVTITEDRNGYTDAIQIHYAQQGDAITVTSDIESDLADGTWVDFVVQVPGQAGLSASLANGGTLEADHLSGQIALSNTNGSIWATNLSGTIALTTQSGSINTKHVSGQLTMTTQNGTITTSDTQLSGHSRVQAETGTINFHGSLDHSASAQFQDTNGEISLTLPQNSAFRLDARTVSGGINTNFPNIAIRHTTSGSQARASIGKPPLALLTIQTTTGPILLQQAG